jgi:hypothetical protein
VIEFDRGEPDVRYRRMPGYDSYMIGDDGTVWSSRQAKCFGRFQPAWRKMKPSFSKRTGYFTVKLFNESGHKRFRIHALVLTAFVGPRPDGMEACHNPDPDRANNRLDNLRWDTPQSNMEDIVSHGTRAKGDRVGRARMTDEKVIEMRTRYASGEHCGRLVRDYPVSRSQFWNIVRGKQWKHLPTQRRCPMTKGS